MLLREVPIGYFFEVITRGFGGMPDYASQIPPDDRWKIIAYIRVLQRSQWMPLKNLPGERTNKFGANCSRGGANVSHAITPATSLEPAHAPN